MKIVAVEDDQYRISFPGEVRPTRSPGAVWRAETTTVYRVVTGEGISGIDAGQRSRAAVRDQIAPRLAGADPFTVDHHFRTVLNWAVAPFSRFGSKP